jgi:hypothetical protein
MDVKVYSLSCLYASFNSIDEWDTYTVYSIALRIAILSRYLLQCFITVGSLRDVEWGSLNIRSEVCVCLEQTMARCSSIISYAVRRIHVDIRSKFRPIDTTSLRS